MIRKTEGNRTKKEQNEREPKKRNKTTSNNFKIKEEKKNSLERRREKKMQGEENAITVSYISHVLSPASATLLSYLYVLYFSFPGCFLEVPPFLSLPSSSVFYCFAFQVYKIAGLCVSFPSLEYKSTDFEVSCLV